MSQRKKDNERVERDRKIERRKKRVKWVREREIRKRVE